MSTAAWKFADPYFDADKICPEMADSAWCGHRNFAYDLVRFVRPQLIVELGVHWGTSFFAFCQAVKDDNLSTKCIAVDTWKGDAHAGFYAEDVFENFQKISSQYYATVDILPLRMAFADALASVEDDSVDILHIDGYHTYEAVSEDFSSWLCKVAPHGIVLFHDVAESAGFGTARYWKELRRKHPAYEFRHSYGLGVLFPKGQRRLQSMQEVNIEDKIPLYEYKAERLQALNAGARLERRLAEQDAQIESLSAQRQEARDALASSQTRLEAEADRVRTLLEAQVERILALEAEVNQVRTQKAELAAKLERIPALEAEVNQVRTQKAELERIPALEAEVNQVRTQQVELEAKLERIPALEAKLMERDTQIESLETTLSTIYRSKAWRVLSAWRKVKYGLVLRKMVGPGRLRGKGHGGARQDEPPEEPPKPPSAGSAGSDPRADSQQASLECGHDPSRTWLAEVESELERSWAMQADSEQQLEQARTQKAGLESQLGEVRARQIELETQVARISGLESELGQARARQVELEALLLRLPGLEEEAEQLRVVRVGLEDQLREARACLANQEARAERIPALESELVHARVERMDLQHRLVTTQTQQADLERRLREVHVQREELASEFDRIQALESERDRARAHQAEFEEQAARIPGLEAKLEQARLAWVDLEGRLNEAQTRSVAREAEQGEARASRIDLERWLEEARAGQDELEAEVKRIPALQAELARAQGAVADLEAQVERIPVLETERQEAARSQAATMSELETHRRQIGELEDALAQSQAHLAVKAEALEQSGQQRRGIEAALAIIEQSGSYRLARGVSRCLPPLIKRAHRRLRRRNPAMGGNGDVSRLVAQGGDLRLSLFVPVSSDGEHLRAKIEACLAQTRPGDHVILEGDQPVVHDVLNEYRNRPGVTVVLDGANGTADTERRSGVVRTVPTACDAPPAPRPAAELEPAKSRESQANAGCPPEGAGTRRDEVGARAERTQALGAELEEDPIAQAESVRVPAEESKSAPTCQRRADLETEADESCLTLPGASAESSRPDRSSPGAAGEREEQARKRIMQSERMAPLVSIVVICWNNRSFLKRCFDSLMRTDYPKLEIFLADNASTDGSAAFVAENYPSVRVVVNPTNLGFAEGNNRAIRLAKGRYIVTLNPDTEVDPGWIQALVDVAEGDKSLGMLSPKMYIMDRGRLLNSAGGDMLLRSGDNLARGFYLEDDGRFDSNEETFGPSAGAGFYRRTMLEDIGLFDQGLFTYYEDVDLNMRAQLRGYRCMYVPGAKVYHYQAGTLDDDNPFKQFLLQRNKWYVVFKNFPLGLIWYCRRDLARSYVGAMRHLRDAGHKNVVYRVHLSLIVRLPRILISRCGVAMRRKPGSTRRISQWMDRHEDTYKELGQAAAVGRYYDDIRKRGHANLAS